MLKMKHLEDLCSQVMLWVIPQVASNMMSKSWNPVLKSAIKSTSKITSASHEIPMRSPWLHGQAATLGFTELHRCGSFKVLSSHSCSAYAAVARRGVFPMRRWVVKSGDFRMISWGLNGDEIVVLVAISWELVGFEQQQWWSICDYSTK